MGIYCHTLVNKINPTHVFIVKGHWECWSSFFSLLSHLLAMSSRDWPAQFNAMWMIELSSQCVTVIFFTFKLMMHSFQCVCSAYTCTIDVFQGLNEWNAAKESVEKHLVVFVLYVIIKAHHYISSHSQSTAVTPGTLQICTYNLRTLPPPTLSLFRVWALLVCIARLTVDLWMK